MKTLHILHSEAAKGWGGQEIRVYQESQSLLKLGHRVSIVCQPESPLSEKFEQLKHPNLNYFPLVMKQPFSLFTLYSLIKIIRKSRPDILQSHSSIDSWLIALTGTLLNIPIIRSRHVMIPVKNHVFNRWLYAKAPRLVLASGRGIVNTVTTNTGISNDKIISIPAGVDLNKFDFRISGEKIRNDLGLSPNQPLIGIVSVIRSWKGHEHFVDSVPFVIENFPDARFAIIGSGPAYESIRERVKNQGLEKFIFMLGHRDDIPEIMAALDIYCVTSFGMEGTTQVIPQAIAMKTPVVSTRMDSILPILGDGKWGILVEPENPQAIANGIIELLDDPELARSIAEKAYTFGKNELSLDRMMDKVVNIYHEVLDNSQP